MPVHYKWTKKWGLTTPHSELHVGEVVKVENAKGEVKDVRVMDIASFTTRKGDVFDFCLTQDED